MNMARNHSAKVNFKLRFNNDFLRKRLTMGYGFVASVQYLRKLIFTYPSDCELFRGKKSDEFTDHLYKI